LGTGSLTVASDWTLGAQRVQGAAGSNQTWRAQDGAGFRQMTITGAAAPVTVAADTALGARLALEGQSIEVGTTLQALSGRITLAARGTADGDDVNIVAGGRLDARGAVKDFNGTPALAGGGMVTLTADGDAGKVNLAAGASVDVSAAAGGNAGTVQVNASELTLGGDLLGASGTAQRSGSAHIELKQLDNFSALNSKLNAGGFAETRSLRVRTGNIDVRAADGASPRDVVAARDVTLAADEGTINVAGTVGSGSTGRAATIGLYAGQGVTLSAGSVINASGSTSNGNGGNVHVATQSGFLNFDAGAVIDVRKGANAQTGSVTLTVPRDASNALGANVLQGTVLSQRLAGDTAATVAVVGQRVYSVGAADSETTVTPANITTYAADHLAFMNTTNAAAVVGGLRGDGGGAASAVLRGATELRTDGDLALNSPWNLTTASWMQGSQPGTLSLRAAGNLTVRSAVGSADDLIQSGSTWNLRMVAGADLAAANPLGTLSLNQVAEDKGDLLLSGASAKLRTGTGRIDLAAARDFAIDDVRGVVYTAGRIGATDTETTGGNNRWGVGGGDITVRAGRDVLGPESPEGDLWITDWLRRPRLNYDASDLLRPANWWAYRPNFQQGLGTLGGGHIDVAAARDVNNLAVMLPTTGRTYLDGGVRQVDVQGGGDLRLSAGNNIVGGAYLIGRGDGRIEAAGDVGSGRAVQLYLMGASSGNVPARASFDVDAGRALRVQSIANPTILSQSTLPAGTVGPSRGNSGLYVMSFFTYSDNSLAKLQAKGGDLSLDAVVA
ncbi:MAG: hypothetical protein H7Y33_10370, partial [Cytophagales bacterium]|nr:hypothetical protein [Rhizobacter sp.]